MAVVPRSQLAALIARRSFEDEYRCNTQFSTSCEALRDAKHDQRDGGAGMPILA